MAADRFTLSDTIQVGLGSFVQADDEETRALDRVKNSPLDNLQHFQNTKMEVDELNAPPKYSDGNDGGGNTPESA